ncbi:hypothetical protein AM588_10005875 [Phytophthora nicotianae]|uniref:Uncharacterized protein n=1 Tax=Phytophthora nicotianae TaxID=4792 RepID=A0A0W8DII2_PHYNI|nr:hypothetical protein AM588_10005875 [Phytophthora nicotianae]
MSFEELLPRVSTNSRYFRLILRANNNPLFRCCFQLMGARDYAGAAKVLEVMYHRFTVTPALCIEASLEILRRQPDYRNDLLSYYEAALNVERIDKLLILKEMWLFHIVHGEFYEAYHLYQDKIEQLTWFPLQLARFLGCYYLDSVEAHVSVFTRWMKDDPTCSYPLEKMLELSSAGAVSSFVLTKVLVEALDTCGSDLYVAQNPNVSLTLWRNLAELLAAMDEGEFLLDQVGGGVPDQSNQVTLADVGAQHSWWKRIYFARPNTVQEVVAMSKRDGTFVEVSIYRAAVADRLFPGHLPMTEALRSAMGSPDVTFSHEHVRLFKR